MFLPCLFRIRLLLSTGKARRIIRLLPAPTPFYAAPYSHMSSTFISSIRTPYRCTTASGASESVVTILSKLLRRHQVRPPFLPGWSSHFLDKTPWQAAVCFRQALVSPSQACAFSSRLFVLPPIFLYMMSVQEVREPTSAFTSFCPSSILVSILS